MNLDAIATAIIDANGGYEACSLPIPDSGVRSINPNKVNYLADSVMTIVAELVASLIDAGSEREAVLENDELRDAITFELRSWIYRPKSTS